MKNVDTHMRHKEQWVSRITASAGAHIKNLRAALLLTPLGELELLNALELRVFRCKTVPSKARARLCAQPVEIAWTLKGVCAGAGATTVATRAQGQSRAYDLHAAPLCPPNLLTSL